MVTNRPRRKARKPIHFNSPELHKKMLERAYSLKANPRWFEEVDDKERYHFALKYATKLWDVSPTGNPSSIVVSYPRPDGTVRIFDLDAGEMFWVPLRSLTQKRISGRNDERNYEYSTVMMDDFRCESEDMTYNVEWEDLKAFDRGYKTAPSGFPGGYYDRFSKEEANLVRLPKSVKDRKDRD